ncbi:MAG: transcription elongation factor GreA [bacterium]
MENQDELTILTPEGHEKLLREIEHLKRDHRAEIRERMANIQKRGEVTEDPEYEEIKKDQAMLESRIAAFESIIQKCRVLSPSEISTDRVGIGSKVRVRNLKAKTEEEYTILSTMESDPASNKISDVSPVGRALMRLKKGDYVDVVTPAGKAKYLILSIKKG